MNKLNAYFDLQSYAADCRLCLAPVRGIQRTVVTDYKRLIKLLLHIDMDSVVDQSDKLPKRLCLDCLAALDHAFLVRQTCQNAIDTIENRRADERHSCHMCLVQLADAVGGEAKVFIKADLKRKIKTALDVDITSALSFICEPCRDTLDRLFAFYERCWQANIRLYGLWLSEKHEALIAEQGEGNVVTTTDGVVVANQKSNCRLCLKFLRPAEGLALTDDLIQQAAILQLNVKTLPDRLGKFSALICPECKDLLGEVVKIHFKFNSTAVKLFGTMLADHLNTPATATDGSSNMLMTKLLSASENREQRKRKRTDGDQLVKEEFGSPCSNTSATSEKTTIYKQK